MLPLENCPWCSGSGTAADGSCPACGGEKLVTRRVAKAIKGLQEENRAMRKGQNRFALEVFALEVIAGLRKSDLDRMVITDLPVPASFTGTKPDTPEAQAARIQELQSRKGLTYEEARERVLRQAAADQ